MKQEIIGFFYRTKTETELTELTNNCTMLSVGDYEDDRFALEAKEKKDRLKILLYLDIRAVNFYWHQFQHLAQMPDVFIRNPIDSKDPQDRLVREANKNVFLMDVTRPAWRNFATTYLAYRCARPPYDGIFIDEAHTDLRERAMKVNGTTNTPIPEEIQSFWRMGVIAFFKQLRKQTAKTIIANTGNPGRYKELAPYLDGMFTEADPLYTKTITGPDGKETPAPSFHKWGEVWVTE